MMRLCRGTQTWAEQLRAKGIYEVDNAEWGNNGRVPLNLDGTDLTEENVIWWRKNFPYHERLDQRNPKPKPKRTNCKVKVKKSLYRTEQKCKDYCEECGQGMFPTCSHRHEPQPPPPLWGPPPLQCAMSCSVRMHASKMCKVGACMHACHQHAQTHAL